MTNEIIEEREELEVCNICGKDLYDGDEAYGTTTGDISDDAGGFIQTHDEPWLTVACPDCGSRISDAISLISGAPDQYTPELLKAAPQMLEALQEAYRFIGEAMIDNDMDDDAFPQITQAIIKEAIDAATPAKEVK